MTNLPKCIPVKVGGSVISPKRVDSSSINKLGLYRATLEIASAYFGLDLPNAYDNTSSQTDVYGYIEDVGTQTNSPRFQLIMATGAGRVGHYGVTQVRQGLKESRRVHEDIMEYLVNEVHEIFSRTGIDLDVIAPFDCATYIGDSQYNVELLLQGITDSLHRGVTPYSFGDLVEATSESGLNYSDPLFPYIPLSADNIIEAVCGVQELEIEMAVMVSDINGIHDTDPNANDDAVRIPIVHVSEGIDEIDLSGTEDASGPILNKVEKSMSIAENNNIPVFIVGDEPRHVYRAMVGDFDHEKPEFGTLIIP